MLGPSGCARRRGPFPECSFRPGSPQALATAVAGQVPSLGFVPLKQSEPEPGEAGNRTSALSAHPLPPQVFLKSGRHSGELSGVFSPEGSRTHKASPRQTEAGPSTPCGRPPFVVEELKARGEGGVWTWMTECLRHCVCVCVWRSNSEHCTTKETQEAESERNSSLR